MLIQPEELSVRQMYAYMVGMITPRPIAWVSTIGPTGVTNLAPFSFFNGVSAKPAALCFSAVNNRDGSPKDTIRNIEATGQFVVNVVPAELVEVMNQTSFEYPPDQSEIDSIGIEVVPSQLVRPPRVKASPIQIECQLIQVVKVGEGPAAGNLVVGQILLAHVDDAVLNPAGEIDPSLVDAVGRMGAADYCWTRQTFARPRPESA
ncbi:MAG: flavin reductase family protein [Pirellulaceae bacterium]|nr:flavin reductase family protein [Pirellulaceae bacterium]